MSNDFKEDWQQCIQAFVDRNYERCYELALDLLGHVNSTDPWHLFFISAQRIRPLDHAKLNLVTQLIPKILGMVEKDIWEKALLELTLGQSSADQVLTLAGSNQERCRAYFYAGARSMTMGRMEEAESHFLACFATELKCLEHYLAAQELQAMLGDQ